MIMAAGREGYSEIERHNIAGSPVIVYKVGSGRIIRLSCLRGGDAASLFVRSDASKMIPIEWGNTIAEYYEADDQQEADALVWSSEDGKTLFCLTAYEEKEVLIKMAESVVEK